MRISNGKYALRLVLDDADRADLVGNDPKPALWVLFNPNTASRFIQLAKHEMPGATRVQLGQHDRGRSTFPDLILLQKFPFRTLRKNLPFFAPEPVLITKSNDHQGVIFDVMRPSMSRPRLERQRGPNKATLAKLARAKEAAEANVRSNSAGLPMVPPQTPLEALDEATGVMTLKAAIEVINAAKDRNGDDFLIQVTPAGKLRVLVAYGASTGEVEGQGAEESETAATETSEPNVLALRGVRKR